MSKKVNLDVAQTLNITCRRGDTFQLNMTLKNSSGDPLNLKGTAANNYTDAYKFAMQVRGNAYQDGVVGLYASTVEGLPEDVEDYILIEEIKGTSEGAISIVIQDTNMKRFSSGRYVYDLQYVIPEGSTDSKDLTTTVLKGAFVVNEDVTHYQASELDDPVDPPGGGGGGGGTTGGGGGTTGDGGGTTGGGGGTTGGGGGGVIGDPGDGTVTGGDGSLNDNTTIGGFNQGQSPDPFGIIKK